MNSSVLITEGQFGVELLKIILDNNSPSPVKYISAGGWSGADSLARSYLTDPDTKVGVVVDADTVDANAAEERKRFLKGSLGQIAQSDRWRVVVIVPEIEALLFESQDIIEAVLGKSIGPAEWVHGKYEPKTLLAELLPGMTMHELCRRLATVDLSPIRNKPEIQELRKFLLTKRRKVAV